MVIYKIPIVSFAVNRLTRKKRNESRAQFFDVDDYSRRKCRLFFFSFFHFFHRKFIRNAHQKGACVNSPYTEVPACSQRLAVEENQTNYFEHAAFSEMGLRLFSRPGIIPGTSLLFHRRGFINRLRNSCWRARNASSGQDFARCLLAATAHAALR